MKQDIQDLISQLSDEPNADVFWDKCHGALDRLGVTSMLYGAIPLFADVGEIGISQATFLRSSHPQEWEDAIGAERLLDDDLTAEAVTAGTPVVLWHDEANWKDATPAQQDQANIERDLGLHVGVTLDLTNDLRGISGAGIGLNYGGMGATEFDPYWANHKDDVRQICAVLHAGIQNKHGNLLAQLSPREADCLCYLALGRRPAEIAFLLGISTKTLEHHVSNAKRKMRSGTRDQAVVKALMLGAIQL